ncbi:MAG: DUF3592 domain-containing protein [Pirellulaceae bacterium]
MFQCISMSALPLFVATIFMLVALAYGGYCLFVVFNWPRVSATILRYQKRKGTEGIFFHPVYRFPTMDGQTRVAISSWGSWRKPWARGETVTVRYCPTNPRRSEIQSFGNTWGFVLTFFALGLMFLAIAFLSPRIARMFADVL